VAVCDSDSFASGFLTAWALARVSTIDPISGTAYHASQTSLASENEEDDEDDTSEGVASFTSEKGLENFSVTSDVVLPLRYTTSSRSNQHQNRSLVSGALKLNKSRESKDSPMDVTSATSASSSSSSHNDASVKETRYRADSEGEVDDNDIDSNMTLGPDEDSSTQLEDSSKTDEDVASKVSSSEFTPDEFWDWLDNVTVAFIDVGDGKLSGSPKKRRSLSGDVESYLTEVNTSKDTTTYPFPSDESNITVMEVESCNSKRRLHYSFLEKIDEKYDNGPNALNQPGISSPVPRLRPSASLADFRPAFEQQPMVSCNVRRTASFCGRTAVDESFNNGSERLKRISSNEDLMLMLHSKQSRSHTRAPNPRIKFLSSTALEHQQSQKLQAYDSDQGTMVCFEFEWLRNVRRLVVVALILGVLLFTVCSLLQSSRRESLRAWKLSTGSIDVDLSQIASMENTNQAIKASKSVALGAYNFVKNRLPESLDEVNMFLEETKMSSMEAYFYLKEHLYHCSNSFKPRIIHLDFKALASETIQEVGDLLKTYKNAMLDNYHNLYARLEDPRLADSLRRLKGTLDEAHVVLIKSLTELCRSETIKGPKEAMLNACDILYDTILELKVPYEPSKEAGLPQLALDRQLARNAFDAMANETLEYVSRFASIIHFLCCDVRGHCACHTQSSSPPVCKECIHANREFLEDTILIDSVPVSEASDRDTEGESHTLPSVNEHPTAFADETSHIYSDTQVDIVTEISDPDTLRPKLEDLSSTSGSESTTMSGATLKGEERYPLVNEAVSPTEATEGGSTSYRIEPTNLPDTISLSQVRQDAARKRVEEILSRLDAKGRLAELEAVLVAKFGPDAIDPPKLPLDAASLGSFPLLGSLRDQYRRDLWLDQLEQDIVESTLAGKMWTSNNFAWASNVRRGIELVLNNVGSRAKMPHSSNPVSA
jgi:hypothetical protein